MREQIGAASETEFKKFKNQTERQIRSLKFCILVLCIINFITLLIT